MARVIRSRHFYQSQKAPRNSGDIRVGAALIPSNGCGGWVLPGGVTTTDKNEATRQAHYLNKMLTSEGE